MDKKDIRALIHLLDDPDSEVSNVVTGNLRELGTDIIPELESAWERSVDEDHQQKIENIIRDIQFRNVKLNLSRWKEQGADDLLEGACWVARYRYPELESEDVKREIARIAGMVWLELNNKLTALEKVRIINHFMFDIHKMSKNSKNLFSPRNSYINLVLESKKGNPVSLAIVYILVARHLQLPVYGVSLPKIFLLAYMDDKVSLLKRSPLKEVLFYINPYQQGAVLGKREIDHYLSKQNIEPQKSFYLPCNNEDIIERLLLNLILSYEKSGFKDRSGELNELLGIIRQD